jgi:hypothetical protein
VSKVAGVLKMKTQKINEDKKEIQKQDTKIFVFLSLFMAAIAVIAIGILIYQNRLDNIREEKHATFVADSTRVADSIADAEREFYLHYLPFSSNQGEAIEEYLWLAREYYFPDKYQISLVKIWGPLHYEYKGKKYFGEIPMETPGYAIWEYSTNESYETTLPEKVYLKNGARIFNQDFYANFTPFSVKYFPNEWTFEDIEPINKVYPLNLQAHYPGMKSCYLVTDYEDLVKYHSDAEKIVSQGVKYIFRENSNNFFLFGQENKLWSPHEKVKK